MSQKDFKQLERRLRDERPAPSATLMRTLAGGRATRRPAGFAVALTALIAVALASVGGVSYAATAVTSVAKVAKKIVAPVSHVSANGPASRNAGGDQYKPGYGFGDPNHNHAGPPGLTKSKPGEKAPPAQASRIANGKATTVSASITLDEQAAVYFSVLDANGDPLLLTQKGSKIGSNVNGPQTKSLHYVVLVPRTIPFTLRIPANLLVSGQTYNIRVIAVDSLGNKSQTLIPFVAA